MWKDKKEGNKVINLGTGFAFSFMVLTNRSATQNLLPVTGGGVEVVVKDKSLFGTNYTPPSPPQKTPGLNGASGLAHMQSPSCHVDTFLRIALLR